MVLQSVLYQYINVKHYHVCTSIYESWSTSHCDFCPCLGFVSVPSYIRFQLKLAACFFIRPDFSPRTMLHFYQQQLWPVRSLLGTLASIKRPLCTLKRGCWWQTLQTCWSRSTRIASNHHVLTQNCLADCLVCPKHLCPVFAIMLEHKKTRKLRQYHGFPK